MSVLFAALARAAQLCMVHRNAKDLASMAWAFATALQSDRQVFVVLAEASRRCMGDFNAQNLANTVWAFATTDLSDALLFAASARKAEKAIRRYKTLSKAKLFIQCASKPFLYPMWKYHESAGC